MPADPGAIARRWMQLLTARAIYDRTRQDIADYVLPRRSNIIWRRSPGARKTWFQYDATATQAAHRVASSLLVTVASPSQQWFSLKLREEWLNEQHEVAVWLEDCAKRLYLAFSQSNFSGEITEAFLDLVVFGTAVTFIEERTPTDPPEFGGFLFRTMPFGTYCLAEGPDSMVDTLYRRFEWTAENIARTWPQTTPADLQTAARLKPDTVYPVLHAVYPRAASEVGYPQKLTRPAMPWASCYVLERGRVLLAEGGYREFPFAAGRWTKATGETYGTGLADQAYPDIATLNRYIELDLRSGEKEVDPPLEAERDSILGEISLIPSEITYVTKRNAVGRLIQGPSTWTASAPRIERLQRSVREAFYYFELDLPQGPAMTATEVQLRWERLLMLLGAALPRVQTEFLTPLVGRCFGLMMRAGALPPVPEVLTRAGGNIDVQYEGPLARSQRAQDATAVESWLRALAQIAQATQSPAVFDTVKIDDASRRLAEVRGVPHDLVQDQRLVQQIRAARQQVIQSQARLDTVSQGAMAAGKAAPMLKAMEQGAQGQGPPAPGAPEEVPA